MYGFERTEASSEGHFFKTTADILSPPIALWESNLELMSKTIDRVMYISHSIVSFLRWGDSGVGTPDKSSVELEKNL